MYARITEKKSVINERASWRGGGEDVTVTMHASGGGCGTGGGMRGWLFFSYFFFALIYHSQLIVRPIDRSNDRPTDPIRVVRRCASERRLIVSEECFSSDRPHHQSSLNSHKYVDSPVSRPIVSRGERRARCEVYREFSRSIDGQRGGRSWTGEGELRINVYAYEKARVSEKEEKI